jgi:hypothetical protein
MTSLPGIAVRRTALLPLTHDPAIHLLREDSYEVDGCVGTRYTECRFLKYQVGYIRLDVSKPGMTGQKP